MEIHAPEHPILSFKEFCVHIGVVTVGILIALSLESLLEWNHHRHLVGEARENIRSEIEDNRHEMAHHLAALAQNRKDQQNALQLIGQFEQTHKAVNGSMTIGASRADLTETSWATAQAMGALGLMSYAEVKRAAGLYQLQDMYAKLQDESVNLTIAAMSSFATENISPEKMPPAELKEERDKLKHSLAALTVQEQYGRTLQKRYEDFLKTN